MSVPLLRQTLRSHRIRVGAVSAGLLLWGFLLPLFYTAFSAAVRTTSIPRQFVRFGSGDLFSLAGTVSLGFEHPFFLAMISVVAVGVAAPAIAGPRQRGTLEVLLARPLSRQALLATHCVATALLLGALLAVMIAGVVAGSGAQGVLSDIPLTWVPLLWFNAFLLFGAFAAFGLAVSAMSNRSGPAIGLTLAYLIANYFVEILGSLWGGGFNRSSQHRRFAQNPRVARRRPQRASSRRASCVDDR